MPRIGMCVAIALLTVVPAGAAMVGVSGGSGGGYGSPGAFLSINETNGDATVLATPYGGLGLTGVAVSPTGRVFAVTSYDNTDGSSHLIELNPATGQMIDDVGAMYDSQGNDCAVGDLSFHPDTGVLYAIAGNQGNDRCGTGTSSGGYLMTIDINTAEYTLIGRDPSLDNSNGGLAFAPDGTLYFTPCWDAPGDILTLDPATADILTTQPLDSGDCYMGLGVRSDGVIFASYNDEADDNRIFTIDPDTGNETLVGDPGNVLVHDIAFTGAARVPVPALGNTGLLLAALALAVSGFFAVRRL